MPKQTPETARTKPTLAEMRTDLAAQDPRAYTVAQVRTEPLYLALRSFATLLRRPATSHPLSPASRSSSREKSGSTSEVLSTCAMRPLSWWRPSICRFKVRSSQASEAVPQLAMRLLFDMQSVREVVSREDLPEVQRSSERRGLAVGQTTAGLLNASATLIDLLDAPEDIPFLKHLIERELIYRILQTPQGERLRAIATAGNLSQRTAKAIAWLSANYARPLRMEELAEIARMGVSTLHHQFRALTGMSPLQFQKQLRLRVARERMLKDGLDATSAAYEVGYESVSQFNREYSRFFGQPPMRDIKAMRESNVVAIDAA